MLLEQMQPLLGERVSLERYPVGYRLWYRRGTRMDAILFDQGNSYMDVVIAIPHDLDPRTVRKMVVAQLVMEKMEEVAAGLEGDEWRKVSFNAYEDTDFGPMLLAEHRTWEQAFRQLHQLVRRDWPRMDRYYVELEEALPIARKNGAKYA